MTSLRGIDTSRWLGGVTTPTSPRSKGVIFTEAKNSTLKVEVDVSPLLDFGAGGSG